jgi:hypothetical protein
MTFTRTSPYRVEINPWVSDDDLHRAFMLRGVIISGLAYGETRLTELAIRASKHSAYIGARKHFPSKRAPRLTYLRNIAVLPGPLFQFRLRLKILIDQFESSFELRDIMAHGRMQVLSGEGPRLNLWDYAPEGLAISQRTQVIVAKDLDRHALRAARLSRAIDATYHKACRDLPELDQD